MQLIHHPAVFERIDDLKARRGSRHQMQTLRGQILDRKGRPLAYEEAVFRLYVSYDLTQHVDSRVARANEIKAFRIKDPETRSAAIEEVEALRRRREGDLGLLLDKCEHFGISPNRINSVIRHKNNVIWDLRMLQVWKAECRDSDLYQAYRGDRIASVKASQARPDLEATIGDPDERLLLINAINILEMHEQWPVLELKSDHDVLAAQLEFLDIEHFAIAPEAVRRYPYGQTAAQTIGWVGPVTERSMELFKGDALRKYRVNELCGRFGGIEYMAEPLLRGRRGEERRDLDGNLLEQTDPQMGQDVQLTLDIELQRDIENLILFEHPHDLHCRDTGKAVVVLDIESGDLLALVSLPTFDRTTVRKNYDWLRDPSNSGTPLLNRALNKHYPPGSVVKPLICVAGLETQAITPDETIGCPPRAAPIPPNCWIFNQSNGQNCHDFYWTDNNARNALKGSCNIYFSQLAERIEARALQEWLFKFGYGRQVPLFSPTVPAGQQRRSLRQAPGRISGQPPKNQPVTSFDQIPVLEKGHRRLVGIGQGECFVTPLQVANSMATLARDGHALTPRLFLMPGDPSPRNEVDLQISDRTLHTILEGLDAVVNETHGTAYETFQESGFAADRVRAYGKTGSTQGPENAWFAGFAKDDSGRGIALAVVVEGGQSGSRDAAPLGRKIMRFCINRGYVGHQIRSGDSLRAKAQPRASR
ncbi:MAG: hypothetical protein IH892_10040 [Planctomycetes bacterium]|nr:hypothetical protein [Planctomycetota bacterium]